LFLLLVSVIFWIAGVIALGLSLKLGNILRVVLIILIMGILDAWIETFIFPAMEFYKKIMKIVLVYFIRGIHADQMRAGFDFTRIIVFVLFLVRDAILILPSVLVRFLILKKRIRARHAVWILLAVMLFMNNKIEYSEVFQFAAVSSGWFYIMISGNKGAAAVELNFSETENPE